MKIKQNVFLREGEGVLHKDFGSGVQHMIQMDLMGSKVLQNKGSKRSQTRENGGHLDGKLRRKLMQNA